MIIAKKQAILCNILCFKEKILVLKNVSKLKGINIFIDEDYNFEVMKHRKKLWDEVAWDGVVLHTSIIDQ